MLSTMEPVRTRRSQAAATITPPPVVADLGLEDASPFGLQGLARDSLQILKPDCINRLAVMLALKGTRAEIRDPEFVAKLLARNPDWFEEYHVVHLIERSLWIQGHSDLVMTLVRNPSQIPDNPPREIMSTLTQAYALHPQATVWYGVPLFGEQTTAEGLPIPVTAAEVRAEATRRLLAAQQHALRWGWVYQSLARASKVPGACLRSVRRVHARLNAIQQGMVSVFQRARRNARRRARAEYDAQREYCRTGRVRTVTTSQRPSPFIDRVALRTIEASLLMDELISTTTPGALVGPLLMLKLTLIVPMSIFTCDPFLFLELPEEPGKLRHLGHWYWQDHPDGTRTLHLHA